MNLEKYLWKYLSKHGEKLSESEEPCRCGSCRYYDFTYQSQLAGKQLWVEDLFHTSSLWNKPVPMMASPKPKYYRNKMDFVTTKGLIGMRRGGFNNVYDVIESCIFDEHINEYLSVLRTFKKYPDYDLTTHEGIIRYYVFRKTTTLHEGEKMHLSIVVTQASEEMVAEYKNFLTKTGLWDKFGVIALIEQPTLTDLSYGTIKYFIKEGIMMQDLSFDSKVLHLEHGLQSFFQANVSMFEVILHDMRSLISGVEYSTIYDLYGGVGSIGFALADYGKNLVSVESNPENTEYFLKNADSNNIKNAQVTTSTVETFIEQQILDADSLAIIDPPRTGMGLKVAATFIEKQHLPQSIIYMSCNPATQVADLLLLSQKYTIESIKAYDMFPYTTHLETVAFLKKK